MNRWVRLWSAFVGMVMIGNLQYAWTLFAQPMVKAHAQQHWQLSDVQWGFGLFIAAGTWSMPFLARFIDTAGPRILMGLSGLPLVLLSLLPGGRWRGVRVRMRSRDRGEVVPRPPRDRLGTHYRWLWHGRGRLQSAL
jgi:MFS family permease